MDYRIFTLNNETCIIHYPEKPNGFGILMIGNDHEYVNEGGSTWLRNNSRLKILQELIKKGYTIFYSNLGGKHMGNPTAVEHIKHLYEYIKRNEILNEKIHIISEGIGAIIVNSLVEDKPHSIRSILFINPIFSLAWIQKMKHDQPFFYKKFLKDVKEAYKIDEDYCEDFIIETDEELFRITCPFKIIHVLEHGVQDTNWIKLYKAHLNIKDGDIHVLLPEKRTDISRYAQEFFKVTENPL